MAEGADAQVGRRVTDARGGVEVRPYAVDLGGETRVVRPEVLQELRPPRVNDAHGVDDAPSEGVEAAEVHTGVHSRLESLRYELAPVPLEPVREPGPAHAERADDGVGEPEPARRHRAEVLLHGAPIAVGGEIGAVQQGGDVVDGHLRRRVREVDQDRQTLDIAFRQGEAREQALDRAEGEQRLEVGLGPFPPPEASPSSEEYATGDEPAFGAGAVGVRVYVGSAIGIVDDGVAVQGFVPCVPCRHRRRRARRRRPLPG